MRRWIICLLIIFTLIADAYAAPCYGTKMPLRNKFFSGIQNYTVFNRYLRNDYGKLRSRQDFLLLSYGVFDWLSIDLKGGAGNIKQHPLERDEINYPSNFSGGYGFRMKLYENPKIKLSWGFQHISVHPKSVHLGDDKNKAVLDDWQFSALCSYSFSKITPYLGAKWSRMDYIHWFPEGRKRRMSDLTKSAGLILGMDFSLTEKAWINLEGQFFDSDALGFSLNYAF